MLFLWFPLPDVGDRDQLIEQQIPGVSSFNYELKLKLASFLEKSVSHDLPSRISHGPKLHTLACYLTATPTKDDLAKTLTIFLATTFLMATFSSLKLIFTSCCRRWTRRRWRTR